MNQNTLTATHEAVDEVTYLQVPGGRIAYEVTGQGPLIVLSHGELRLAGRPRTV